MGIGGGEGLISQNWNQNWASEAWSTMSMHQQLGVQMFSGWWFQTFFTGIIFIGKCR